MGRDRTLYCPSVTDTQGIDTQGICLQCRRPGCHRERLTEWQEGQADINYVASSGLSVCHDVAPHPKQSELRMPLHNVVFTFKQHQGPADATACHQEDLLSVIAEDRAWNDDLKLWHGRFNAILQWNQLSRKG